MAWYDDPACYQGSRIRLASGAEKDHIVRAYKRGRPVQGDRAPWASEPTPFEQHSGPNWWLILGWRGARALQLVADHPYQSTSWVAEMISRRRLQFPSQLVTYGLVDVSEVGGHLTITDLGREVLAELEPRL